MTGSDLIGKPFAAAVAGVGVSLLVLDGVWLHAVMRQIFRDTVGDMARESVVLVPTAMFYVLYAAALLYFAVWPAVQRGSLGIAAVHGALLGLLCYATYDLTNMATLKRWTWQLAALDVAWGTFVSALSAVIGFAAWQVARR